MENIILIIAAIGFISLLCQWLSWKIRLPSILLLLISGLILGPLTHILNPSVIFGSLFHPIINLGAAIILFEGSLTLNFKEVKDHGVFIRRLITLGVPLTFILTTLCGFYVLKLSWELALMLGAIMIVTGPTVITPMLRAIRPKEQISNILRWEGILVDPIGVIVAIIVYSLIAATYANISFYPILFDFLHMILIAIVLGLGVGYGLGQLIIRHRIPDFLHNVAILIMVITCFALANYVDEGSGLLTVTFMGICFANLPKMPIDEILGFKESLTILLVSGLFIILAADMSMV